jgi:hypothetical protein
MIWIPAEVKANLLMVFLISYPIITSMDPPSLFIVKMDIIKLRVQKVFTHANESHFIGQ